ncbi:MAG: GGDEF domain-containing protein [Deltaproteobacteria bacterium]|nr:GGDEF domain-containing protein [Deltaproteobacteria bacterium]
MHNLTFFIVNGLVIGGTFILAIALFPVWKLTRQLPAGTARSWWKVLTALIVFFICGYSGYAYVNWWNSSSLSDLLVPGVFLGGAVFVLMVCSLSLKTVVDLKRVHVLEQENISDPLMGIFNRRYLDRRLKEELLRSQRYHLPLAILLLDVDRFKAINDTCGHQTGDLVLKKLGQLMLAIVRDIDIVARYGGEEVLVIMPNTSVTDAAASAERLRRIIEETPIATSEEEDCHQAVRITVSIGVAGLRSGQETGPGSLLADADSVLYQAKKEGRNRVAVCS